MTDENDGPRSLFNCYLIVEVGIRWIQRRIDDIPCQMWNGIDVWTGSEVGRDVLTDDAVCISIDDPALQLVGIRILLVQRGPVSADTNVRMSISCSSFNLPSMLSSSTHKAMAVQMTTDIKMTTLNMAMRYVFRIPATSLDQKP